MKNVLKIIIVTLALIVASFAAVSFANELVVTGDEAKDLNLFGEKTMTAVMAIMPCMTRQQSLNANKYEQYYTCVCKEQNTTAIYIFKSLNDIVQRHPNWKNYSSIKVQEKTKYGNMEGSSSATLDIKEFQNLINAIKPCL